MKMVLIDEENLHIFWKDVTYVILKVTKNQKFLKENIRTEPGCHLYCTASRLVLLLHFNITKLFKLFNDHTLFSPVTFDLLY